MRAFAGGARLIMLGDTMIPEASAQARRVAGLCGLCLVLGFALTAPEATAD